MRLASLKKRRDGDLVIVSRDGLRYTRAGDIAPTLREAIDNWAVIEPDLLRRAAALEVGDVPAENVDSATFAAPLPRAAAWLDGSTFVNHIRLMNRAMGTEMNPAMTEMPLMYQGGADDMLGPNDPIVLADEAWGVDLEAELGVIVDDVPMTTSAADALRHIKLVVLINDVSLRNLQPREFALGFGMVHAKPSTGFAPFAVTPDELGAGWANGQVDITMLSHVNDEQLGSPRSGTGMLWTFADLIAHASRTRRLSAGTIIGSGTISNEQPVETARVAEGGVGFSCLSEARAIDIIRTGSPKTPFLSFGDRVRIEARDAAGRSPFGIIDQQLVRPAPGEMPA